MFLLFCFSTANNLYGVALSQKLPLNNYEFCEEEFDRERILSLDDDADEGYIFEVDLSYPPELHDLHKDYPFLAEKMQVPNSREKKLLLTLYDKKNYCIHYRMLKMALQQGLILDKVHRVVKFNQSAFIEPFVRLNTELRTKATNDFEKNLFKLLINSIFGKCLQNVRNQIDIKMKNSWDTARKLISKPHFKRSIILDPSLVAIEMNQTSIKMCKPIAIARP